jgi:hypothetical protein
MVLGELLRSVSIGLEVLVGPLEGFCTFASCIAEVYARAGIGINNFPIHDVVDRRSGHPRLDRARHVAGVRFIARPDRQLIPAFVRAEHLGAVLLGLICGDGGNLPDEVVARIMSVDVVDALQARDVHRRMPAELVSSERFAERSPVRDLRQRVDARLAPGRLGFGPRLRQLLNGRRALRLAQFLGSFCDAFRVPPAFRWVRAAVQG